MHALLQALCNCLLEATWLLGCRGPSKHVDLGFSLYAIHHVLLHSLLVALLLQVVRSLTPVEANLLSGKVQELERCLEPGLVRLNWNNRGIDAFVHSTTKSIQEFQALHHSVQKNSAIMEKLVNQLASTKLVADLPAGGLSMAWLTI